MHAYAHFDNPMYAYADLHVSMPSHLRILDFLNVPTTSNKITII